MPKIFLDAGSVGRIVSHSGRLWRVGLINPSRARLDPLTGTVTMADPVSGRTFNSYGSSVNIGPSSYLDEVDVDELDDHALSRYIRMEEDAMTEANGKIRQRKGDDQVAPSYMFEEETPSVNQADDLNVAAAAVVPNKTLRDQNKDRLMALKNKKAAMTAKSGNGATTVKTRAKGAPREQRACACGCGAKTGGYFVPGHDARFKGLMLRIERGEEKKEKLLKGAIISNYKWVKTAGGGERTTTNYKGEPHSGYAAK